MTAWPDAVSALATAAGIGLGGVWAYWRFIRGRTFGARALLEVDLRLREIGGSRHVEVRHRFRNSGTERLVLGTRGRLVEVKMAGTLDLVLADSDNGLPAWGHHADTGRSAVRRRRRFGRTDRCRTRRGRRSIPRAGRAGTNGSRARDGIRAGEPTPSMAARRRDPHVGDHFPLHRCRRERRSPVTASSRTVSGVPQHLVDALGTADERAASARKRSALAASLRAAGQDVGLSEDEVTRRVLDGGVSSRR